MILQQLYKDADAILKQTTGLEFPPSMYLRKKIRWIIELNDGMPPQFALQAGEGKGGERGLEFLVPNQKRSSGVRPLLFADKTSYVLGIDATEPGKQDGPGMHARNPRTELEFSAFRGLARACANATGDPHVERIAEFLETWDPYNPSVAVPADLTPDQFFTFRVNGELIIDNPAVRLFWAGYGRANDEDAKEPPGSRMQCLVSGISGQVEEMMPVPVKGLYGGKSEMAIVSANASAFESYGLKRAHTSPICRDAGERFGQALNALLASPDHHTLVQANTYIFWSPAGTVRLPMFDPQEIKEFLRVVHSGKHWYKVPPTAKFFLFGLVPNAARVAVRTAIETTVEEIERRQMDWFERLSILGFDETGKPVTDKVYPLRLLAVSAYREFKDIEAATEDALVRTALLGAHLPYTLLQLLVNRCRVEKSVTYPRAALLKYYLTQHLDLPEAKLMSQEITIARPQGLEADEARAYHLGRLFAELEAIQSQAIPGINAGIADKFYGSACSTPASVFGLLLDGVQNHLGKLRKSSEGAYGGAQKRIEDILACIDGFPKTLALRSQALFSLGYYHHRADRRRIIAEASAAKKAGTQSATSTHPSDIALAEGDEDK